MTTTVVIKHDGPPGKMLDVRQFQKEGQEEVGLPIVLTSGAKVVLHAHADNCFTVTEPSEPVNTRHLVEPQITGLSFGDVLEGLWRGKTYARAGWNGANQYITMQVPDEHSKMRNPYLYISPVDGRLTPWAPSQTDVLASDWEITGVGYDDDDDTLD